MKRADQRSRNWIILQFPFENISPSVCALKRDRKCTQSTEFILERITPRLHPFESLILIKFHEKIPSQLTGQKKQVRFQDVTVHWNLFRKMLDN